uniref:Uncharacterized protein n=1 Tax=Sphaerodactylus townsendi TaxID=933632 RepID=A0ACB8ED48_9SAUR
MLRSPLWKCDSETSSVMAGDEFYFLHRFRVTSAGNSTVCLAQSLLAAIRYKGCPELLPDTTTASKRSWFQSIACFSTPPSRNNEGLRKCLHTGPPAPPRPVLPDLRLSRSVGTNNSGMEINSNQQRHTMLGGFQSCREVQQNKQGHTRSIAFQISKLLSASRLGGASVTVGLVAGDPPTSCCFSYVARKIPRNLLKDYYETSSKCSQPGVVFTTKKGKYICANPKEQWVQDHMNYLDTKPAVSE